MQRVVGNRAVTSLLLPAAGDSGPMQRDEAFDDRPEPGLLALLDELEAATNVAANLAAKRGEKAPAVELLVARLEPLREIARGSDEAAKRETLAAAQTELDALGLVSVMGEAQLGPPVQRMKLSGAAAAAITVGLGYLTWRVYEYIQEYRAKQREERDRGEDALLEAYADLRFVPQMTPDAIPTELLAGIARQPTVQKKATRLFENVNEFRFRYTGEFVSAWMALHAHQGDCQTLVDIYQIVAAATGIRPCGRETLDGPLLVESRPIHGRQATGNTEDGALWFFNEHYWIVAAGTEYDLLFMTSPRPPAVVSNGTGTYRGVTYYTFPDGRDAIMGRHAPDVIRETRVFPDHAATIEFLNEHRSPDGSRR